MTTTAFAEEFELLTKVSEARQLLEEKRTATQLTVPSNGSQLPISQIVTVPLVLQPRLCEHQAHISELRDTLKTVGDLDPILVFPADDVFVVVDGHHRLEAYRHEERESISAEFWDGTVKEAITEAIRRNSKVSLTLDRDEKINAAWQLNLMGGMSKKEIMATTGIGKGTVDRQRAALKALQDMGEDPEAFATWKEANAAANKLLEPEPKEYTDEMRRQRMIQMATSMARGLPKGYQKDLDLAAGAVQMMFGKNAVEVAVALLDYCLADPSLADQLEEHVADLTEDPEELAEVGVGVLQFLEQKRRLDEAASEY